MKIKLTGGQFAQMLDDDDIWGEDAYIEEETVIADGKIVDEFESVGLDTKEVVISSGYFINGKHDGEEFAAVVKGWLRKQSRTQFIVECEKLDFEAVKSAIKAAGGKVI